MPSARLRAELDRPPTGCMAPVAWAEPGVDLEAAAHVAGEVDCGYDVLDLGRWTSPEATASGGLQDVAASFRGGTEERWSVAHVLP